MQKYEQVGLYAFNGREARILSRECTTTTPTSGLSKGIDKIKHGADSVEVLVLVVHLLDSPGPRLAGRSYTAPSWVETNKPFSHLPSPWGRFRTVIKAPYTEDQSTNKYPPLISSPIPTQQARLMPRSLGRQGCLLKLVETAKPISCGTMAITRPQPTRARKTCFDQ